MTDNSACGLPLPAGVGNRHPHHLCPKSHQDRVWLLPPYSDESTLLSSPATDYAAHADPSIFTGVLTKEVYNGIRDSMAHREEILAGTYVPAPLKGITSLDELASLSPTIGIWPSYQFKWNDAGEIVCRPRHTPA